MAREGKILISVDLIKTGVNRWGRWSEVQQETAHLSGFSTFLFPSLSLPIRLPSSLSSVLFFFFPRYIFGFQRVPIQSFLSAVVTDDKNEKKKKEKKSDMELTRALEGTWAFSLQWIIMGWASAGQPSTGPGMLC